MSSAVGMARINGRRLTAILWLLLLIPPAFATTISTLGGGGTCTTSGSGAEYRNLDGTCNNLGDGKGEWGAADTQLLRLGDAAYSYVDGASLPRLAADGVSSLPSTRAVSNAVVAQSQSIFNANGVSSMLMQWGQFLDHDLDLTHVNRSDPMNIVVPEGDLQFSNEIPFSRSVYDNTNGTGTVARQQTNTLTAFIDASQIYGSDADFADSATESTASLLRTGEGGRLKMTGDYLHMVEGKFVSGDERAREQVGLTAMHTLFNREHNRLAAKLESKFAGTEIDGLKPGEEGHAKALDEKVYQEARKLVGGMMQAITYNEFLPALLGSGAPGNYTGYDENVNPGIANEFSTAAYRFGHSTLSDELWRLDGSGNEIEAGHLPLAQAFFNPEYLLMTPGLGGVDAILRGLVAQRAQEVDPFLVDAVRNLLFAPPVDVGFDLAALNMQRGRDHGLPSYTEMRRELFGDLPGFQDIVDWGDLDAVLMAGVSDLLKLIYEDVDDIDLWIGGLAEQHINGGLLGETFAAIVADQFRRLRDGDRFWYENGMFESEWLDYIEGSTLSRIIMRNTGITGMQANVFFVVPEPGVLLLLAIGLMGLRLGHAQPRGRRLPSPH